jgi:hypothetical protein
LAWSRTYSGGAGRPSRILGVDAGPYGSVLVAGNLDRGSAGADLWVARIDSGGNVVWSRTVGTTRYESANAVAWGAGFTWVAGAALASAATRRSRGEIQ